MNSIENIDIHVADRQQTDQPVTANVKAILHEINTMLHELLDSGTIGSIDVRSLPLLPGEYEALKVILGEGEISVILNSLGQSRIHETALAGVWWITHSDEQGDCQSEFIEVTRLPAIIQSDLADIDIAHAALQQQLQEWVDQGVNNDA